jgi:hypothetical protein
MKNKIYVGVGKNREIFRSATLPVSSEYSQYGYVIGPFRTLRGAKFMVEHGQSNPHCNTVLAAEKLSAGFVYDICLGKWIK